MEKITINSEEVRNHTIPETQRDHQPLPSSQPSWKKHYPWIIGAVGTFLGVIALVVLTLTLSQKGNSVNNPEARNGQEKNEPLTVERWAQSYQVKLTQAISDSDESKKFIESIHPFVTYKNASVEIEKILTIDGSDLAGDNGKNIFEIRAIITYRWAGPVRDNGFTKVRMTYDYQGQKNKGIDFLESNAVINTQTIDWMDLGAKATKYIPLIFGGQ